MSKTPPKRATKQAISPESSKTTSAAKIVRPARDPRKNVAQSNETARNDAIRTLAHLKWESAGCPEGDGAEFWYAAEREILAKASKRRLNN